MKSSINTEAGLVTMEASTGRVSVNGRSMLPHEAVMFGSELIRIADRAATMSNEAAQMGMAGPMVKSVS